MFSADSRYVSQATYAFALAGGQTVAAVRIPAPRASSVAGYYPGPPASVSTWSPCGSSTPRPGSGGSATPTTP